jgi:uncharacterized membrane protein
MMAAMTQQPVAPTREDPVAGAVSEVIGGPLGDHAAPHRGWGRGRLRWVIAPAGVLMLMAAVLVALGFVKDTTCYDHSWNNDTRYTHMCYSDLPYLYTGRGFVEHDWPYSSDPQVRARFPEVMEYPVGIGYWAWGASWVTHWLVGSPDLSQRYLLPVSSLWGRPDVMREVRGFVIVNGLGFAVIAIASAGLLARVVRRRPWDAAAFALSPTLALTGLINWDMCAVIFVAGAMLLWARGRPGWTGVMIGLGTATKLYPLFLLGPVLVICLRERRLGDFWRALATAALAWVVADLPGFISGADQWAHFWKANADRGADLGSLWYAVQGISGHTFSVDTVNLGSWLLFAAWCAVVLVLGLKAPNARFAQLGYLVLAGFLIINKVYSPQYVLWLLPLAALARPRWRDQIIWQASEVVYFCAVWWYLGGELDVAGSTGQVPFYWAAIFVRVAGELWLAAMVVRDMYRPAYDPVAVTERAGSPAQEISVSSKVVVV